MRRALGPYNEVVDAVLDAVPRDFVWVRDITLSNTIWGIGCRRSTDRGMACMRWAAASDRACQWNRRRRSAFRQRDVRRSYWQVMEALRSRWASWRPQSKKMRILRSC